MKLSRLVMTMLSDKLSDNNINRPILLHKITKNVHSCLDFRRTRKCVTRSNCLLAAVLVRMKLKDGSIQVLRWNHGVPHFGVVFSDRTAIHFMPKRKYTNFILFPGKLKLERMDDL